MLHLVETIGAGQPWVDAVSVDTVTAAVAIGEYAEGHARRTFGEMGSDAALLGARRIHAWLLRRPDVAAPFTTRDAHVGLRSHFPRARDVHESLVLLEELGWLRGRGAAARRHGRGRPPSEPWDVNPAIRRAQQGPRTGNCVYSVDASLSGAGVGAAHVA